MMKTPDEIKKVLEHCIETGMRCHMCDYVVRCLKVVRGKPIMQDALALIQQLEAGLAQWEDVAASPGAVEDMARENYRLTQELEAIKRERDAALAFTVPHNCSTCKHKRVPSIKEPCNTCIMVGNGELSGWQWRDVCPDNTEVQEDE